jgi:hypothetical protein
MSLSSFSLVIGVFFYVFGFPLVFSDESFVQWCKKLIKDLNVLRMWGAVLAAIAVTTLRYQWRVTPDGSGIIVLIAWVTLVKGILIAWWPKIFSRLRARVVEYFFGSQPVQAFTGFVMVLVGALFTYLGFVIN